MRDGFYMEEVTSLVASMTDLAEKFFEEAKQPLSIDESNEIFDALLVILEKQAGHPDYRSYN